MQSSILYYINTAAHNIQLQYNWIKVLEEVIMLCGHVCISAMQNQMGFFVVGFFCLVWGFFSPKYCPLWSWLHRRAWSSISLVLPELQQKHLVEKFNPPSIPKTFQAPFAAECRYPPLPDLIENHYAQL